MKEVTPLFMKYGAAIAPALFVNNKLELYGGVPTLEKLVETLRKHLT
jgi:protein-disulfide isomerase